MRFQIIAHIRALAEREIERGILFGIRQYGDEDRSALAVRRDFDMGHGYERIAIALHREERCDIPADDFFDFFLAQGGHVIW